ncbi:MAG: TIGR01841 family phasin [Alphaproteobacteria bacterium]
MVAKTKRAQQPTAAVENVVAAGKDTMEQFVKAGADGYEKAFETAQDRMQDMMKNYDEMAAIGQKTMAAFMASGTAYAKGYEMLSAELMAFSKQSMEEGAAVARAAMTVKSLQELMDLQTGFAKSSLDSAMAQGTKISEIATKLAQDTVEPLNEQMTAAFDTATKTKAA